MAMTVTCSHCLLEILVMELPVGILLVTAEALLMFEEGGNCEVGASSDEILLLKLVRVRARDSSQ
jgi:hypothetical protein